MLAGGASIYFEFDPVPTILLLPPVKFRFTIYYFQKEKNWNIISVYHFFYEAQLHSVIL